MNFKENGIYRTYDGIWGCAKVFLYITAHGEEGIFKKANFNIFILH